MYSLFYSNIAFPKLSFPFISASPNKGSLCLVISRILQVFPFQLQYLSVSFHTFEYFWLVTKTIRPSTRRMDSIYSPAKSNESNTVSQRFRKSTRNYSINFSNNWYFLQILIVLNVARELPASHFIILTGFGIMEEFIF